MQEVAVVLYCPVLPVTCLQKRESVLTPDSSRHRTEDCSSSWFPSLIKPALAGGEHQPTLPHRNTFCRDRGNVKFWIVGYTVCNVTNVPILYYFCVVVITAAVLDTFYDCWLVRCLISSSWYKPWWMEGIYPPQPDHQPPAAQFHLKWRPPTTRNHHNLLQKHRLTSYYVSARPGPWTRGCVTSPGYWS